MNNTQKKYALNRIYSTVSQKQADITLRYAQKPVKLSAAEFFAGVLSGKIKRQPVDELPDEVNRYTDLNELWKVPEPKQPKYDSTHEDSLREEVATLGREAADQIMLGDCEEALKIIAKLDAWVLR